MADLQQQNSADMLIPSVLSKRQRRPSVRLNEIGGDQPTDSYIRKAKQWKGLQDDLAANRTPFLGVGGIGAAGLSDWGLSKTRPLGNLPRNGKNPSPDNKDVVTTEGSNKNQTHDFEGGGNPPQTKPKTAGGGSNVSKKSRQTKGKRGGVRSSSNTPANNNGSGRFGKSGAGFGRAEEQDKTMSNNSYDQEGMRDDNTEGYTSESPIHMKESSDNHPEDFHSNRKLQVYVDDETRDRTWTGKEEEYMDQDGHDDMNLPSDADKHEESDVELRESNKDNGRSSRGAARENGVVLWLNSLGLGRYADLFEMHEVDCEVLPMLTLDDLRDMGINAVGSRRKLYTAIQKLQKSFSL